jgi:hypothetical protein
MNKAKKEVIMFKTYKRKIALMASAFLFILLFFSYPANGSVPDEANKKEILNKVKTLQIPFIENKGQIKDKNVGFYAKTMGGTFFITKEGEMVYSLPFYDKSESESKNTKSILTNPKTKIQNQKQKGWIIKESLVGTSISNVKGEEKATTKVNYFKGKDPSKWRSGIETYNLVSMGEVYKGIELKLKAYGNNVEKLFYVNPGYDSEKIKVKMEGTKGLKVNKRGELEASTGLGVVKFTKPVAYQKIKGEKKSVDVAYDINKGNTYGFKVGNYDKKRPLIIDPLLASTFIGGSDSDNGESLALDGSGNIYVAGWTKSSDYPTTPGAYKRYNSGDVDVFVSKLNSNLSSLLASTFIGGSDDDGLFSVSIALDGSGNVYVTGRTESSDYPITSGAYDESFNGGSNDVFVSKLDNNLSSLLASTFIGGDDYEEGYSIALDGGGNIYVTGHTLSSDYPTTPGAYDESFNGMSDVFVSKLDNSLSSLIASTFIGGISNDWCYSLALDRSGNVYVTGHTYSSDYTTTIGAYDESLNDSTYTYSDVFVSKFNNNLSSLLASTFIGGSDSERGYSLDLDGSGNVYVTGRTESSDYPITSGAYDESFNENTYTYSDVFVSKLDSSLSSLLASTFIGGRVDEYVYSIILDGIGNVYVIGWTQSFDYPTTSGAYDESYNGDYTWEHDVFISKLDSSLSSLLVSTFIGGGGGDAGYSITLDGSGNVYVTGYTGSWEGANDYPTTTGAYDESFNGGTDIFVSKLDRNLSSGTPCPAKVATNNSSNLKIIRKYKDNILTHSESGRKYIKLYYQHAPEVTSLLIKDSELMQEAKELLNYIIPEITLILKAKKVELLDSKLKNEIINFFNQVQEKGSPELEAAIEKLMDDIENERYISYFQ